MNDVQIIRSPGGEEMVLLSRADYDALVAAAYDEDLDDIALYDARKAALAENPAPAFPSEASAFMLRGDSRLKALRRWRALTQAALAGEAGIGQGYLSAIEGRSKTGSRDTLQRLAKALDVPLAWID